MDFLSKITPLDGILYMQSSLGLIAPIMLLDPLHGLASKALAVIGCEC